MRQNIRLYFTLKKITCVNLHSKHFKIRKEEMTVSAIPDRKQYISDCF